MDNPYDIHSWSKDYRQERLVEARNRQLAAQASGTRRPLFSRLGRAAYILSGVAGSLKG